MYTEDRWHPCGYCADDATETETMAVYAVMTPGVHVRDTSYACDRHATAALDEMIGASGRQNLAWVERVGQ